MMKRIALACTLAFVCLCLLLTAPLSRARGEEAAFYTLDGASLVIHEGVKAVGIDYEETGIMISLFNVTQLTLPKSLRVIGDCGPFYGIAIRELTLPEGLEKIGEYAFQYSDLRRVSLPSTLREFSAAAFGDCDSLSSLTVAENNPWYRAVDDVLFSKDGTALIYYPAGREGAHYDVPAGVRVIAARAFQGNDQLETVALPLGLQTIEKAAFADCGRLTAVSVPLTLKQVGAHAFRDCVSLERIALGSGAAIGELAFDNCPLLKGYDGWKSPEETYPEASDHASTSAAALSDVQESHFYGVYAILSPGNAEDKAAVYAAPNGPVAGRFARGSTVAVRGTEDGWYRIGYWRDTDEAEQIGYVRHNDAVLRQTGETLFRYAGVAPKDASARQFSNGPCVLPLTAKGAALRGDETLRDVSVAGQWCGVTVCRPIVEDDIPEIEAVYAWFLPSDLRFTREKTGDGKTFGVVTSDDPRKRLNLRNGPDKKGESLGRYFSGTQVEILGEQGDWYRVRVDFTEGYMMKAFVDVVPEEE